MHELKILEQDNTHAIIGGYGVVFGGTDLDGETFTAETDFMLDLVPVKPVFIDHSEDTFINSDGKTIKLAGVTAPVGKVLEVTADDVGLYMKLQLEKAGRYWGVVEQMIGTGKAGLSSGTVGHLARRKGKTITRWPIVEESITLTPAEPRTVGIERLKALVALNPGLKAVIPEAASETAEDDAGADESLDARCRRIIDAFMTAYPAPQVGVNEYLDWWVVEVFETYLIARLDKTYWQVGYTENGRAVEFAARDSWVPVKEHREWVEAVKSFRAKSRKSIVVTEKNEMAELDATPGADDLNAKVDALSEAVNKITKVLEDSPALKRAGYTTDDGGTADPTHKSFGDWLLAVKRNDVKRLQAVYGSTKDMAEAGGATGGYLVPQEHLAPLLRMAEAQSAIYARVTKQPVSTDAGDWPALDQFLVPTAGSGNTALAGGVTAATTAEGGALTETQPTFVNLEYRIHKIGGFVEVSNELIADSPTSIETLLRNLFSIAISARNERNILRGTGVGEPLGILNAPCTIGVTTATNNVFAYADVLSMMARFKSAGGSPVWITHPSVIPDIGVLSVASGSPVVWAGNLANSQPSTLLGYPILFSEHMPQADGDDVILADLSAYILFERAGLSVAFSEHAAFTTDKGTWRFTTRNDGQPWVKSAITLADPSGSYTVSPFVYHND